MSSILRWFVFVGLLAQATWVTRAGAEAPDGAEAALAEAAYPRALALAQAAIESGSLSPEALAGALRVSALASAHLNDVASSLRAFTLLLAVKPDFRLERGEADEVRSPYLEARGFWSAHATALSITVSRDGGDETRVRGTEAAASSVELTLVDPAGMVARVRLRARPAGQPAFSEVVLLPDAQMSVTLPGLGREQALDYSVTLLDEHGNRISKLGSDEAPAQLAATRANAAAPPPSATVASPLAAAPPNAHPRTDRSRRLKYLTLGTTSLVLGASAAAVGIRAHIEREELADRWNRGACSGTGSTRAELCADERSRIERMETLTTVLYSAGAAALITGAVLVLLAPSRKEPERAGLERLAGLHCGGGVGSVGISCARGF
jgi:hypothetical protein